MMKNDEMQKKKVVKDFAQNAYSSIWIYAFMSH